MGIIRLLLAFAVFNSHFPTLEGAPIVNGHEAVLTFFAISGFYMALILDRSYRTARDFYLSRFLTLYPIYVLALAVSLGLLTSLDVHSMTNRATLKGILSDPAAFLVMAWTSATTFGQELLFSLARAPEGGLQFVTSSRTALWSDAPLIQGWSLSLELTFYALAPFMVRMRTRTVAALGLASLALKIGIMLSPVAEVAFYKRFFPLEFWLFCGGVLAYRVHRRLSPDPHLLDYFLFILLVGLIFTADAVDKAWQPFFLPGATLCVLPLVFRAFKRLDFDRLTGKVSYPFYLLHYSVIALFEAYEDAPEGWHILIAGLAAALAVHFLFNSGIETLKTKLRRRHAPLAPVGEAVLQPVPHPRRLTRRMLSQRS
ncbi:MAG: acyltransferase family protein [Pseudodesulfovibrio sp.]|uniref:Acyltransferase n=1 Tax=Pseudodesulfovibrio indicus TaxID=1716143 RepID=A0A126QRE6_9BACT|nr:acyltransferase [Pseudodesulfovibrio indicus]AMK12571.1 acyltransferase [Pseudodesulfovibrio indicus]TDT90881.1 peptidoglycan/LPS O-acetylase OafA/YrhL [Pseudodesulfovibrio indicus]